MNGTSHSGDHNTSSFNQSEKTEATASDISPFHEEAEVCIGERAERSGLANHLLDIKGLLEVTRIINRMKQLR
jgi:hypothetical protein